MLDEWNVLSSSTAVCAWVEVLHDIQNPPPPLPPWVSPALEEHQGAEAHLWA